MVRDDNRSEDLHQPVGNHENAPAVAGSAHRYYGVLLLARGGRELQQAFRQRREREWQVSRTRSLLSGTLIRGPAAGLTLRYSNRITRRHTGSLTADTIASFRALTKWLNDWSILAPIAGRLQAVVKVSRPITLEYRR